MPMLYVIPTLTLSMIAYMIWLVVFRLRRERVSTERAMSRGKRAFRPKERVRFLLQRAFELPADSPEWERPLVSSLARRPRADAAE